MIATGWSLTGGRRAWVSLHMYTINTITNLSESLEGQSGLASAVGMEFQNIPCKRAGISLQPIDKGG